MVNECTCGTSGTSTQCYNGYCCNSECQSLPCAPVVTNSTGATEISQTSAVLNGELTDMGGAATATVYIFWGDNDGATNTTAWDSSTTLGSKTIGTFSTTTTGLTENKTYYYRYYAFNSGGNSWSSATESFSTSPYPATVTNSTGATEISQTSTVLNGELTDMGGAATATVYIFWGDNDGATNTTAWDSSTTLGSKTVGTFSTTTTGLTENTPYFYRCYAENAGGGSWSSTTAEFITLPYSPIVTNSTGATYIGQRTAVLNGELTYMGGAATATVYVYWGDNDGSTTDSNWDSSTTLGSKAIGTFFAEAAGLSANTPYYYRCYGFNAGGGTWSSTTQAFVTFTTKASAFVIKMTIGCDCSAYCTTDSDCYVCYGTDGTNGYCDANQYCTSTSSGLYPETGTVTTIVASTTTPNATPTIPTPQEGVSFNSIMWNGTKPANTEVRLRLATSDDEEGPWTFYGESSGVCNESLYYAPNPGVAAEIKCFGIHNNKKYYKVQINLYTDDPESTPIVEEVIVNYSL